MRKIASMSAALLLTLGLVACGGGGAASTADAASGSADAASAEATSAATSDATSTTEVASTTDTATTDGALTAADLASVDVTVALDDFDAMRTLADDIQEFRDMEGKVVQIDGYVSNFAKGMSYSIVENDPSGKGNVGTVFVIEGVEEDAYPSDGTHVLLTGKVGRNDTGTFLIIHTLPEFVVVQE